MRRSFRLILGMQLAIASWFLLAVPAQALDVSVTAAVITGGPPANPIVQFKGRASPNISITILRDGASVATTMADSLARFDTTLTDQPTGQHTYELTATDASGLPHASMTFALNLSLGSTMIISGIFLGPTLDVDKDIVKLGEPLTFSGMTAPSSTITLTVQSDPRSYAVTADATGRWNRTVLSSDFGTGSHTASAMALANDNTISEDSISVGFAVNPLEPCDGKSTADLNCDGKVNLTDFSILLFFWLKTNPSNIRADINTDGQVTIVDFSIMLFQWTG